MSEHAKVILFICGVVVIVSLIAAPLVQNWWQKRRAAEIAKVQGKK
jgi:hypothetical protein